MRTTKDKTISPQQMKALHATFRSKGFDEEDRHDLSVGLQKDVSVAQRN